MWNANIAEVYQCALKLGLVMLRLREPVNVCMFFHKGTSQYLWGFSSQGNQSIFMGFFFTRGPVNIYIFLHRGTSQYLYFSSQGNQSIFIFFFTREPVNIYVFIHKGTSQYLYFSSQEDQSIFIFFFTRGPVSSYVKCLYNVQKHKHSGAMYKML